MEYIPQDKYKRFVVYMTLTFYDREHSTGEISRENIIKGIEFYM